MSMLGAEPARAATPLAGASARDLAPLTDQEFNLVSKMVGELTGIVIKSHKREMIQSRLSRRARALGIGSYGAYLEHVCSGSGADEVGEFINAVTTNLTSFFRESHHFDDLRETVLPALARQGLDRRVRIWSSACSSGEEPYSIIMTVLASEAASMRNLKLLATDLDTQILGRASRGVYNVERLKGVSDAQRSKHLIAMGDEDFQFNAAVKNYITFNQLNLLKEWPFRGPFDVIFCRNVLIYFDEVVKKQIVDRMVQLLTPGGTLYLGHSESLLGDHPQLLSEGRTIYRRKS